MAGKLLIVGTPIGNLADLTPRAIEALKSADLILCEDTRHTRKLLTHFAIDKPTQSFHEHNEEEKAAAIVERIAKGSVIALVSDAGPLMTPLSVLGAVGLKVRGMAVWQTKLLEKLMAPVKLIGVV